MHLWYRDDERNRSGGVWRSDNGCGGELLASTGYVVLWGNALEDLAETLAYGDRPGQAPFAAVAAALTWRDMSPPEPAQTKAPNAETNAENRSLHPPPSAAPSQPLRTSPKTWPGRRNISLFDEVRLWAYRAYRNFIQYEDFAEAARQRALAGRERMPVLDDFEDAEAANVARSVSVWTWTKKADAWKTKRQRGQLRPTGILPAVTGHRRAAIPGRSSAQRRLRYPALPPRLPHPAGRHQSGTPAGLHRQPLRPGHTGGQAGDHLRRDAAHRGTGPEHGAATDAKAGQAHAAGTGQWAAAAQTAGRQTKQRYWNHHWTGDNSRAVLSYSGEQGQGRPG